jgi:branched-chain amino acid transport system permease protein
MPPIEVVVNVLVTGVLTGLLYGLMALGLSVIFGVMRVVNFAHGEMTSAAMYATVALCAGLHIDPFLALLPITVAFFVIGYGLQRVLINRFIARPEHTQLLVMLAIATMLMNLLLMGFGPDARGVQTEYQLDSIALGPLLVDTARVYAAGAALAATLLLLAFFRFTLTGKALRACADNQLGARVIGLDVGYLYALAFGIGSACVAVAGCVSVVLTEVTPSLGPGYTLLGFVIVIVGGLGSMAGALLGGVLIGASEALAGLLITPSAKSMVSFGLLIVILLVRPQGLLGRTA